MQSSCWQSWQERLTVKPTLHFDLPPLRMLLVLDDLADHKPPEFDRRLFEIGIIPPYTPVGGSWLYLSESIQRVLERRAFDGQYPTDTAQIIAWYESAARHWDAAPKPFVWGGRRAARRRRQRELPPPRRLGGLLALPGPETCRIMATGKPSIPFGPVGHTQRASGLVPLPPRIAPAARRATDGQCTTNTER